MSKDRQVYKKYRPLRVILTVIGVALAVILLLMILIYFGFRKYIVYTPDGLYLDIPWLEDVRDENNNGNPPANTAFAYNITDDYEIT